MPLALLKNNVLKAIHLRLPIHQQPIHLHLLMLGHLEMAIRPLLHPQQNPMFCLIVLRCALLQRRPKVVKILFLNM